MSKYPIFLVVGNTISMGLKKLVTNAMFLALLTVTLPSFGSAIRDIHETNSEIKAKQALESLFNELSNKGHLKAGDKALVITNGENNYDYISFGGENEVDSVSNMDIERQNSFPNEYFDFILTHDFSNEKVLIDRILKKGGIVSYKYTGRDHQPKPKIMSQPNYEIVTFLHPMSTSMINLRKSKNGNIKKNGIVAHKYTRKYQKPKILSQPNYEIVSFLHPKSTSMVSLRKSKNGNIKKNGIVTHKYTRKYKKPKILSQPNYEIVSFLHPKSTSMVNLQKSKNDNIKKNTRKLLGLTTTEEKKEVLENLEDVLLEPPRATRSQSYLKRTKYLPDLLGDSFDSYKRRVFIDVGPPEKSESAEYLSWFGKHYPTRNKDFEIYRIDTVAEASSGDELAQVGISDWLRTNVREEEYVVMKAEAEIVEEMEKNKVLSLVDELFLECKYQGVKGQSKKSRRAYWECLALYGRLRDEGIAVHQWWG